MKKIIVILVSVLLSISLITACGSSAGSGPVGKYKANVNIKDAMNEFLKSSGTEINISSDLTMNMDLELKSDETFKLDMDAKSFTQSVIDMFKKEGSKLFEQSLAAEGVSSDDMQMYLDMLGYDSLDAMAAAYAEEMGNMMASSFENTSVEGKYKIENNKISFENDGTTILSEGTINGDGSITFNMETGEFGNLEVVFKK